MVIVQLLPPLSHFFFVLYPREVVEESGLGRKGGEGGMKREINNRKEGGKESKEGKEEREGEGGRGKHLEEKSQGRKSEKEGRS